MANYTVVKELERALKGKNAPKRIQVFFYGDNSSFGVGKPCLYIDNPAWLDDGEGGGAVIGTGPMSYDPYEIAGWRTV